MRAKQRHQMESTKRPVTARSRLRFLPRHFSRRRLHSRLTDADFFSVDNTARRTRQRLNVNYFRALRARPPRCFRSVVSRKSPTSARSRSTGFFSLPPRPPPPFPSRAKRFTRESARAKPTSEPPVSLPLVPAAVRHGLNGETRRSESDTLPLFRVPPRVGAGETATRVCVRTCARACAHSRVLVHPRAATLLIH